jgi:hypothetical protein
MSQLGSSLDKSFECSRVSDIAAINPYAQKILGLPVGSLYGRWKMIVLKSELKLRVFSGSGPGVGRNNTDFKCHRP